MRQSKTSNGVTTNHYYDGQNVALDETNGNFTAYNRGLGLLSRTNQNGTQYYHFNIHGDTSALTDSNGEIVLDYRYDAFGNQLKSNENDTNPFRYCGEYFDEETGFVYLRNRYYDPSIGRFMTEDPHWNVNNMIYGDEEKTKKPNIAIPKIESIRQASNLFAYCMDNPVVYKDSTGKSAFLGGIIVSSEFLPILGSTIVILGYIGNEMFVKAFNVAISLGKTIKDSLLYAKGKVKAPKPPAKLKNGDKVKTPDTHPDEFKKNKDGSYTHKKTKWTFKKDRSGHGGEHWDASPSGKNKDYINVNPNGSIR